MEFPMINYNVYVLNIYIYRLASDSEWVHKWNRFAYK